MIFSRLFESLTIRTIRTLFILVAFALGMGSAAPVRAADLIRLTTQDWPPYQQVDHGQLGGIAVNAVHCIFDRLGLKIEIKVLPWARAQKAVQEGAADGFFTASEITDRNAFAVLSEPFVPQVWRWYQLPDTVRDVGDKTLKVGVLAGSAMEKWLADHGYTAINTVSSTDILVKIAAARRIDAVLSNELVFARSLEQAGLPATTFRSVIQSDRPLGMYLSKDILRRMPGLMDQVNTQIPGCRM